MWIDHRKAVIVAVTDKNGTKALVAASSLTLPKLSHFRMNAMKNMRGRGYI
jgi:hypothetical protein